MAVLSIFQTNYKKFKQPCSPCLESSLNWPDLSSPCFSPLAAHWFSNTVQTRFSVLQLRHLDRFWLLIITICNSYMAPNPTRLAQSTSQFKTRMNVRIKTWNMHTPDDTWLNLKFTNQPASYALLFIFPFFIFPLCVCTLLEIFFLYCTVCLE